MNQKQKKHRKIMKLIGVGLTMALILTLGGGVLRRVLSPVVETTVEHPTQPDTVPGETMRSDWKAIRERAKGLPLEGQ